MSIGMISLLIIGFDVSATRRHRPVGYATAHAASGGRVGSYSVDPADRFGREPVDRVAGDLYDGALFVALWMTGLGLGLSSDIAGFLAPLRNVRLLAIVIVLDVVAIPLLVWTLTHLFGVPIDSGIGLLLVGIASAGPLGITASRIAGGDARAAVSFVIVLEAANGVAIPVWVALLLPAVWPCLSVS